MAESRSSEEVHRRNIEVMGQDLGPYYTALHNELSWLYVRWQQYQELFGTKPERTSKDSVS